MAYAVIYSAYLTVQFGSVARADVAALRNGDRGARTHHRKRYPLLILLGDMGGKQRLDSVSQRRAHFAKGGHETVTNTEQGLVSVDICSQWRNNRK